MFLSAWEKVANLPHLYNFSKLGLKLFRVQIMRHWCQILQFDFLSGRQPNRQESVFGSAAFKEWRWGREKSEELLFQSPGSKLPIQPMVTKILGGERGRPSKLLPPSLVGLLRGAGTLPHSTMPIPYPGWQFSKWVGVSATSILSEILYRPRRRHLQGHL